MGTGGIAWSILAAVTATGLVVIVRTRWLQSRTLAKCVALSVLLHGVLAVVCAFVGGWTPASWGRNDEGRMSITVALAEEPVDAPAVAEDSSPSHTEPAAAQDARTAPAAATDVPAAMEIISAPPCANPARVEASPFSTCGLTATTQTDGFVLTEEVAAVSKIFFALASLRNPADGLGSTTVMDLTSLASQPFKRAKPILPAPTRRTLTLGRRTPAPPMRSHLPPSCRPTARTGRRGSNVRRLPAPG